MTMTISDRSALRNKGNYVIEPEQAGLLKKRMLNWATQFSIFVFLDNNEYSSPYGGYECLLATGGESVSETSACGLEDLQACHKDRPDWMFGHICYDFKNSLEPKLESRHGQKHGWKAIDFFVPETVCFIDRERNTLTIETFGNPASVYDDIRRAPAELPDNQSRANFRPFLERDEYLKILSKLRDHIKDGDCYEINFCSGGCDEVKHVDPLAVFGALNKLSPAPFAAYYRSGDNYMMCASPERYLRKEGTTLTCQPIKGTARRAVDAAADVMAREQLRNDIKERAENVMIVDLMRNDLARCCVPGTVTVDELFGIYTFPQVHQMISTVSGTLRYDLGFSDAIEATFPMGSMTGAPKYKVMKLIDEYEPTRRELFSGTIGYVTPAGDMDFNVIIRSLFYNALSGYLSYHTGGAITYDSVPEKEWEEMRLKAWALERIFGS